MRYTKIIAALLCLLAGSLEAQNEQQFRVIDQGNGSPVAGIVYQYGDQKGLSDLAGTIRFEYLPETNMYLSHLNYGSWTLNASEILDLTARGTLEKQSMVRDLHTVTVIAVRQPAPTPGQNIDVDYPDRMAHDGAVILNQLPAFNSIRKSGNYGFDPVFRGFKYDQLNIVLNGAQSATAACPNRMDPPTSQMAPNMMDRIEVLKGPYALRFGTGVGATINFIPSRLRLGTESSIYGRLSGSYESNGNIARSEAQVGLSGSTYDWSLFGAWAQGDDYRSGNGETVQSEFSRGSFGTNLGWKISTNQQLRVSATYNRARDADFPALPMDLREDDTWMFNARHDFQINGTYLRSWNTTAYGSFVDHRMDNLLKPLDPRMLNAETTAQTYNYGGRTEGVWVFRNSRLFTGADYRMEGARGIRTREFLLGPNAGQTFQDNAWQDGQIARAAAFGEYNLGVGTWQYILSGRLEWNQAKINDADAPFLQEYPNPQNTQNTQVNPGLSVGIVKSWTNNFETSLWLGRVQRSGSLTERFINFFPVGLDPFEMLGNPELNAETNNQTDLSISWTTEQTTIGVSVFAAYLQDYISSVIDPSLSPRLPMSPGVRRFVNIQEAFKAGFEFQWAQSLPLGLQQQVGIAYTYAQDWERDEPLPEIPPLDVRYTINGNYLKSKLQPEFSLRYVAEQSRISAEFGETVTPSFFILDMSATYSLFDQLRIRGGVNNLLDVNYYEHLNRSVRGGTGPIFAPGRNIFANVSFQF